MSAAPASDVPLETKREEKPTRKKTIANHLAVLSENVLFRAWVFTETFDALASAAVQHRLKPLRTLVAAYVLRSKIQNSKIDVGFLGDPSFYGLGIRLGVYLHWLAILITAAYLKEEEQEPQYVLMAYLIFGLSIPLALIVKILNAAFTSDCTFSVELFIALVLFWGGYHIVQFPMMQAVSMHKMDEFRKVVLVHCKMPPRSSRRLRRNMQWFTFVISPITIGFWIGIRHVEEGFDFGATPGGTKFFFFGRIHGSALKPFGTRMVIASFINFVWSVFTIIPRRLGRLPGRLRMLENRTTGDDFSTYRSGLAGYFCLLYFGCL